MHFSQRNVQNNIHVQNCLALHTDPKYNRYYQLKKNETRIMRIKKKLNNKNKFDFKSRSKSTRLTTQ